MPSLADYEEHVRAVCLGDEPSAADLERLGSDASRFRRYREMVRKRLEDVLRHAFPRLEAALGDARFDEVVDRFHATRGPRSPYIRDVPGELLAWLEEPGAFSLPPAALPLARYEWASLSTSYADDGPSRAETDELDMARPAVLLHAHRLLELPYAVHREDGEPPAPELTLLCLYRDPETHEVRTLELTRAAHALLTELETGGRPLASAIAASAARAGAPLDRAFLEATSALLADLVARGLIVGSAAVTSADSRPCS